MEIKNIEWVDTSKLTKFKYTCGYCSSFVAPDRGYYGNKSKICICPYCSQPTYFDSVSRQTPGRSYGNSISSLPEDIGKIYNEARICITISAHTASAMLCRKLLMNIAVHKGAKEGLSFLDYVKFLDENSYILSDGKEWVDYIRKGGNDANHKICLVEKKDAKILLEFCEMLLKLVFEFPKKLEKLKGNN